jgi:hypothetical protein
MDGEQYDDDGARRTKAFTTVKKMMMTMTVQERGLPGNFGIASSVVLPFLPMPKGI